MVSCEMCGKTGILTKAIVENCHMMICPNCTKYGRVLNAPSLKTKPKFKGPEISEEIINDYANKIRSARESLKMTQLDLAHKLNEKESNFIKMERGEIKPTIEIAKKLEHALKIKLVETIRNNDDDEEIITQSNKKQDRNQSSSSGMTIGDLIKFKIK